jgi:hypothetical protein
VDRFDRLRGPAEDQDESECDTEDDFETSHAELKRVRLETVNTAERPSRPIKRNPIRAATTAGIW